MGVFCCPNWDFIYDSFIHQDAAWFRVLMSVVMGGLTLLALLFADVDKLGQILGVLVMGMTIIFATTAAKVRVYCARVLCLCAVPVCCVPVCRARVQ